MHISEGKAPKDIKKLVVDKHTVDVIVEGLGQIPEKRMVFRLLGAQPGQKAVVHVTY